MNPTFADESVSLVREPGFDFSSHVDLLVFSEFINMNVIDQFLDLLFSQRLVEESRDFLDFGRQILGE
jgi:hypothetical protein